LLEGVHNMQESTTYQAILREGRNEGLIEGRVSEAQRRLLLQGEIRFGPPDEATRSDIEAIRDVERLERIIKRLLETSIPDWNGLLSTL
jgi:predicted transposase YdaD